MNTHEELPITLSQFDRNHPLAEVAFRQLLNLNEQSRRHVYDAAIRLIRRPAFFNAEKSRAFKTLLRWLENHPKERTRDEFDRWRLNCRPKAMSSRSIARAFGGWSEAVKVVESRPLLNFNSVRRRARGVSFTDEELIEILRSWADAVDGELTWFDYRVWAKAVCKERRVPREPQIFRRRFGGTAQAFRVADIAHRAAAAGQTATRPYATSRETLIEVVHRFTSLSGETSSHAYCAFRADQLEFGLLAPSEKTLRDRLGDGKWSGVLAAAGIEVAE